MAIALAKIHKTTPIDWFDKYRDIFSKDHPILKDAPKGSHLWKHTGRGRDHLNSLSKMLLGAIHEPLSEAGKRIVLVHNDLHKGNMIVKNDKEVYVIDYESAIPSWAAIELGDIMRRQGYQRHNLREKFQFCREYLKELRLPNTDEDVELLMFDIEYQ